MRTRLVVLAAALVFAVIQLSRESGRAVAPLPGEPDQRSFATPAAPKVPVSPSPMPFRDPFRFLDEEPLARPSPGPANLVARPPSPEPAPARSRLVGLVRSAGGLRAVLVLDGEVVLASAGDSVGGFRVLSLDEDEGVRIRDPEGLEAVLALPDQP